MSQSTGIINRAAALMIACVLWDAYLDQTTNQSSLDSLRLASQHQRIAPFFVGRRFVRPVGK